MPVSSPSGISSVRPSRKPTTSAGTRSRRSLPIRHSSPTSASGPVDSTTRPITSATRPMVRYGSARPQALGVLRERRGSSVTVRPRRAGRPASRSSWEPSVASTSPPRRAHDHAAALHAAVADQLEALAACRPAPAARPRRPRSASGRPGCRRPGSAVAHVRLAQRAAQHVGDALGLGGERRLQDLLGDLDGELDQRRLGLLEQPRRGSRRPRGRPTRRTQQVGDLALRPAPCPPRSRPRSPRSRALRGDRPRPARAPPRPARRPGAARWPGTRSGRSAGALA